MIDTKEEAEEGKVDKHPNDVSEKAEEGKVDIP